MARNKIISNIFSQSLKKRHFLGQNKNLKILSNEKKIVILATHPDIRIHVIDLQLLTWWVKANGLQFWINTSNPKEVQFVTTEIPKWLWNLDLIITIFFSLRYEMMASALY
jgi:hypothetical protein